MNWKLCFILMAAMGSWVFGQTGISGNAGITLEDGGLDCQGHARVVLVWLDLTGITGTNGEPAGLNAFCAALGMDTGHFLGAMPGADAQDWQMVSTDPVLANGAGRAVAVGVKADPFAPDSTYHLATFYYGGQETTCLVSFDDLNSSFGSRVVLSTGDGPGLIPVSWNGPLPLSLPEPFPFLLEEGFASWRHTDPAFDLAAPTGPVNVLDLVKAVVCIP